jgi:hypothetical protein
MFNVIIYDFMCHRVWSENQVASLLKQTPQRRDGTLKWREVSLLACLLVVVVVVVVVRGMGEEFHTFLRHRPSSTRRLAVTTTTPPATVTHNQNN